MYATVPVPIYVCYCAYRTTGVSFPRQVCAITTSFDCVP